MQGGNQHKEVTDVTQEGKKKKIHVQSARKI